MKKIDPEEAQKVFLEEDSASEFFKTIVKWYLINTENGQEIKSDRKENLQYIGVNKYESILSLNNIAIFLYKDENGLSKYYKIKNNEFVEAPEFDGLNNFNQKIDSFSYRKPDNELIVNNFSQRFMYYLDESGFSDCDDIVFVDIKKITCLNELPETDELK